MKLHILGSYAYLKGKDDLLQRIKANPNIDMLLDSGAFTAYNTGKVYTVAEYAAFVKQWGFKKYFTLDVIGDPVKTRAQYDELRKLGLKPIPIFTRGGEVADLEYYAKTSDVLALGAVSLKKDNTIGYVEWFMKEVARIRKTINPKLRVHWLGWSDHDMILEHKPNSYDNSSWLWSRRHRYVAYLKKNRIHFMSWHKIRAQYRMPEIRQLAERVGIEAEDLLAHEAWLGNKATVAIMAAYTYFAYGKLVEARFGTEVFLVFGDRNTFEILEDTYNRFFKE